MVRQCVWATLAVAAYFTVFFLIIEGSQWAAKKRHNKPEDGNPFDDAT